MFSGEARIHITAQPEQVYDLVTDVTRMGDWSPETVRGEWVDGATGPAVGAKFKGHNKRGPFKWATTPTVVTAERPREFAFDTGYATWRYRFDNAEGGTLVVETFEGRMPGLVEKLLRLAGRERQLEKGAQETLQRLKAAAESASSGA